jgi:hypothetical protein
VSHFLTKCRYAPIRKVFKLKKTADQFGGGGRGEEVPVDVDVIEDKVVDEFAEGLDVGAVVAHQALVRGGILGRLVRGPYGIRVEASKRHFYKAKAIESGRGESRIDLGKMKKSCRAHNSQFLARFWFWRQKLLADVIRRNTVYLFSYALASWNTETMVSPYL